MDDRHGAMPVLWPVLAGVALVAVIGWCSYLIWRDLRAKAEQIFDEAIAGVEIPDCDPMCAVMLGYNWCTCGALG